MMIYLHSFSTDKFYQLIAGLLLSSILLLTVTGSYYYIHKTRQDTLYRNASHEYELLVREAVQKPSTLDQEKAKLFAQRYLNTPYYALMQFQIAYYAIQRNELPAALNALSAVIQHSKDSNIEAIARQRGARVLMAMKQFKQALSLIEHKSCENYRAACQMIKGDIFLILGEKQKASQCYESAKQTFPDIETVQPLLQMKLDDLGNLSEALPL